MLRANLIFREGISLGISERVRWALHYDSDVLVLELSDE